MSKEKPEKKKGEEQTAVDETSDVSKPITGGRYYRRTGDIPEAEQSSQIWLISFTDVMALMLTFFVLLFSMTEPQKQDWSEISSAVRTEFNKFYGAVGKRGTVDAINVNKIDFDQALNINYLAALIETVVSESKYLENITLIPQQGHLIISLPQDLLFEPGQADMKETGSRALYALGGALARISNQIEVIGHADPRPVSETGGYGSNWELSMLRALNAAALLESVGYQKEIVVRGLSSGRYQDLSSIKDETRRMDISRRVDIVVLDHDGSKQKVFLNNER